MSGEITTLLVNVPINGLPVEGFFFIAVTVWGLSQYGKVKRYQERDRKTAQRKQDPFIEIIEAQESEFNAVLDEMKSHTGRRDALYGQPWYLLLGEQGSGKSQFIQRSGLSFLFSTVLNASKTQEKKTFDWWVGNEAVIIDPDGALITQDSHPYPEREIRQWRHFIDWLEQTRRHRPLNGVVVTIDVIKLIERDEASRLAYAAQIRSRLKELMETIASRLPIYVVLTKWDSLNGFEPFFRHCNAAERASILGFTYSLHSLESIDEWLTEFSQDYDRLIAQLNALLIDYEIGRSGAERQAMFSFVKQVSGLKHGLQTMLETMFLRDKFSTPGLLRGTYFTSVEQQGVPHDIFDDAIARRYQLTAPSRSAQQAKQSLVYFASTLFENAIIPEAGLATDNIKVLKQKRRLILYATMTCCLATILLLVGWQHSYGENRQRAENVLTKVRLYQSTEQDKPHSPQAMLASLEQIRSAMLAYGFFMKRRSTFLKWDCTKGTLLALKWKRRI